MEKRRAEETLNTRSKFARLQDSDTQFKQPEGVFQDDDEDLEKKRRKKAVNEEFSDDDQDFVDSDLDDEQEPEKEQNDDMFMAAKPAKPKYLSSNDIQGQDWSQDVLENVMPFNLDQEMEEGKFDQSGNYIKNKEDELAIHDTWLQGIDTNDMERARIAHDIHEKRSKALASLEKQDPDILWRQALIYMQPGENLLNSMARLGGKRTSKWKKQKAVVKLDKDAQNRLEQLTSLVSSLSELDAECYERKFEYVVARLKNKKLVDQDWKPGMELAPIAIKEQEKLYEYKWGNESTEIFGPFPSKEMNQWSSQGFFTQGNAYIRKLEPNTRLDTNNNFVAYDPSYKF